MVRWLRRHLFSAALDGLVLGGGTYPKCMVAAEAVTANGRTVCRAALPVQCSVCNTDVMLSAPSSGGDEVMILECNHTVHLRCFGRRKSQQKVFRCPDCGKDNPVMPALQ